MPCFCLCVCWNSSKHPMNIESCLFWPFLASKWLEQTFTRVHLDWQQNLVMSNGLSARSIGNSRSYWKSIRFYRTNSGSVKHMFFSSFWCFSPWKYTKHHDFDRFWKLKEGATLLYYGENLCSKVQSIWLKKKHRSWTEQDGLVHFLVAVAWIWGHFCCQLLHFKII